MIITLCYAIMFFLLACGNNNSQESNTSKTNSNYTIISQDDLIETGQSLFLQKCASCHAVNMNLIGPALKGVEKRWHYKENLYAFIRNAQEVIAKDAYAKDLFESNHKVQMPPFSDLKDNDILAILTYIKNASISARH